MKFVCDNCNTKYSIADDKVRRKVLKIRCKNCNHIIVVRDPARGSVAAGRGHGSGAKALDRAFAQSFEEAPAVRAGGSRVVQAVRAAPLVETASEAEELPTMMNAPPEARPHDLPQHEDEWYLAVEGHQFGPMSYDELCKRVKRGEARGSNGEEAFVWHDGFDDWIEVASVPELRPYVPPPPPPRGRSGLFPVGGASLAPALPVADRTPAPRAGTWAPATQGVGRTTEPSEARLLPFAGSPAAARAVEPSAVAQIAPASGDLSAQMNAPADVSVSAAQHPSLPGLAPSGGALPAQQLPYAPPAPQTPLMMKLAALGGIVSMLIGTFILVYVFFIDRPAPAPGASSGLSQGASTNLSTSVVDDQDESQPAEEGGTAAAMDFPVMEIPRSHDGRGRPNKRKPANEGPGEAEGETGDKLSSADRKLLERFKDSVDDVRVPSQEQKQRVTPTRNITQAEVQRLQMANKRSIQACYNRALKRDYSLKDSRADVTLVITPAGRVKTVRFSGVSSQALTGCLHGNLRRWAFRPIGGTSAVEVSFSLLFRGAA